MSATLELAQELIRRRSLTPDDAGCQDLLAARLEALDFAVQRLPFGDVSNLWARRGRDRPLLVLAGHTDVVPTGPVAQWSVDPFAGEVRDGWLYGRGAADMKGGLAAMVTAGERFLAAHPRHRGSIGFLLTSDEEGPARDGTVKVIEHLERRGEKITWCLLGEPTSGAQVCDTIKNGRRGSLHGRLLLKGVQGHVAYPHLVQNPIHAAGPIIAALADEVWDHGNDFFPPTSLQITNLHGGSGAVNVVPGEAQMQFNFRFSTAVTVEQIQDRVRRIVDTQLLNEEIRRQRVFQYDLDWQLSGLPFITSPGELVAAAVQAIRDELGIDAALSTTGGTSDGRFIAPTGAQVIELGPLNATIHKIDERVAVADLERLSRVYEGILVRLLA
ncbi:MAG: succinyl-diaminopimelate desuccinylase [Pseudomonadota bacterium]|nr:succinyl-diaminopimelate desuccinylase [Pseudomonadota bacterium]